MVLARRSLILAAGLCSCGEVGPPSDIDASPTEGQSAQLIGVDSSGDFADRACQVILRDAGRVSAQNGFVLAGSSWAFDARVDVLRSALAEGAVPYLLVRAGSDPNWREIAATASTPIDETWERVLFDVTDGNLPGPGMSATGLSRNTVKVIPFLKLGNARLFDHNRVVDPFSTYVLNQASNWKVESDAESCVEHLSSIDFGSDFSETLSGELVPGGRFELRFALERLPQCRTSVGGRLSWSTTAFVRFLPEDVVREFPVMRATTTDHGIEAQAASAEVDIPSGAEEMQVWFRNSDTGGCEAWDSDFGQNYRFSFSPATDAGPDFIGVPKVAISRGGSRRCEGAVDQTTDTSFDSWARQRASLTDFCFEVFEPGVTDFDNPDLWRQLDVQVIASFGGQSVPMTQYVPIAGRVGPNAQYAIDLRGFDPFQWGRCLRDVPTTVVNGIPGQESVQAKLELEIKVNGKSWKPPFGVTFIDYANAPRVACE